MNDARDVALISGAETRRTLTSIRAVVLLGLFALFSTLVLLTFHALSARAAEQVQQRLTDMQAPADAADQLANEARKPILAMLFGSDETLLDSLAALPMAALALLKATWMFLPPYVAVMGFDQLSGEVGPRSIRFLAVRTRRRSILVGKWLAQLAVLLCLVLVVNAGTAVFLSLSSDDFTAAEAGLMVLRFSGITFVFALTYTALTTLCSAVARSPAVSLTLNLIALFVLWLVATLGGLFSEDSLLSYLRWLSPWHYVTGLLHPTVKPFLIAASAHLGFAALFLVAAGLLLRERDL